MSAVGIVNSISWSKQPSGCREAAFEEASRLDRNIWDLKNRLASLEEKYYNQLHLTGKKDGGLGWFEK